MRRRAAGTYGASVQVGGTWQAGGGDTMARMEDSLLFLVICVTKVLIDDRRDVFPLSLEAPTVSRGRKGAFYPPPPASSTHFGFRAQPSATKTHIRT